MSTETSVTFVEKKLLDYVNRSMWPEGPWSDEPDFAVWRDGETGLICLLLRNAAGAWCGYVGLPEGHKYCGEDSRTVDWELEDGPHGGVTYSREPNEYVGYTPDDGPAPSWYVGFDCGHVGDATPRTSFSWAEYRTFEYAVEQATKLASQLK